MMGRNHMMSATATGSLVAVAAHLPPGQAVPFIAVTTVCGLLPDFDHPNALAPRAFLWPGRALAAIIGHVFGHRTLTHSVLGLGILAAGLAFVLPGYLAWAVLLGCVTHILGDMLTESGVPVWWPHPARWRLLPRWLAFGTDSHIERLVVAPVLFLAAAAGIGLVIANA